MRTLLFVVILGLLAVVHSTPVNTVTQITTKAEDEVFREAATDGFLVENFVSVSSAPESPETDTTVQASQQLTSASKEIEGSGWEGTISASLQFGTTTVSHALSSASTVLPRDTDDSTSDSSTTKSPQSSSTSAPNEAQTSVTPDHTSASQTTAVSIFDFLSTQSSDSGSGDGMMEDISFTTTRSSSMTSSSKAKTSTASSTLAVVRKQRMNDLDIAPQSKANSQEANPEPTKAGGTPGWMIIVGFVVGLAALVMLFVAIATKDRWNGPSRASEGEDKTNSSNQQRELEMETFLRQDNPKENGHPAEYTVIPLEELTEKHSSH